MNNTKYPRTYHFPFSPGATNDDKIVDEGWFEYLKGKELVITEKLLGNYIVEIDDNFDGFLNLYKQATKDSIYTSYSNY